MVRNKIDHVELVFQGTDLPIRVENTDYLCLTDLNKFVPERRLDHFMENKKTQEYLEFLYNKFNNIETRNIGVREIVPVIYNKRGGRGGGGATYAHRYFAYEFCGWLSPEFKYMVHEIFDNYRTGKLDWTQERDLSIEFHHIAMDMIKEYRVHDEYDRDEYKIFNWIIKRLVLGENSRHIKWDDVTTHKINQRNHLLKLLPGMAASTMTHKQVEEAFMKELIRLETKYLSSDHTLLIA